MSAMARTLWIAQFTWTGARRRWIVFLPLGLLVLMTMTQAPRIAFLTSLFADADERSRALAGYADLLASIYDSCVLIGAGLAVALGTTSTGARGLRAQLAPILARPLSRHEFVLGRLLGNGLVMVLFWLLPALLFEIIRLVVGTPLRVEASAYPLPLLLHLLLLAFGMWLGTLLRPLPASFLGLGCCWVVLVLSDPHGTSSTWPVPLAELPRWCLPPLRDLLQSAAPFADPFTLEARIALMLRALAWAAFFTASATWRFERIDFVVRDY